MKNRFGVFFFFLSFLSINDEQSCNVGYLVWKEKGGKEGSCSSIIHHLQQWMLTREG